MGCFSFMCKECKKPVNSTSFEGENVILFLLKNGKVLQQMQGEYDSYGRVFIPGSQDPSVKHKLPLSLDWTSEKWGNIVTLHLGNDKASGIAAIHTACYKGVPPTTKSDDDPDQGWGELNPKYMLDTVP